MKNVIAIAALGFTVLATPSFADNFDYCYDHKKGLDEACLARKDYEEAYYDKKRRKLDSSTYSGYGSSRYSSYNSSYSTYSGRTGRTYGSQPNYSYPNNLYLQSFRRNPRILRGN